MIKVRIFRIISISFWIGLVIIISSLSILAQEVISITENGNKIKIPISLQQELANNSDNKDQTILEWYSSNGYLNAEMTAISPNQFEIKTGCRFQFIELIVEGYELESVKFTGLGDYSKRTLQIKIDELLKELESEGYIFSRIEIASILPNIQECEVSVKLSVEKGRQWITEKVLFPGAKSNKNDYLRRISGFRDSLIITSRLLNELKLNLEDSELFEEVAVPEVFLEEEKAVIVIGIQERILNQFDGLLGYVPDQNGNGQIVGDFELSLWNVLKQGNGFELEYQRLRPETSRLNIGVAQDWFGAVPVGLGFNFNIYQNDTTYQTRNLSLDSYYLVSRGLRLTGSVGQVSSTSSNIISLIQEPDGKKRFAELGFRYSTTNNIEVPTSGIRFAASFGVSNKKIEIDSIAAFSQRFIHSEASYFLKIAPKSVLAFTTQSYFLSANKVTESDLLRFGGANSFRGYSEEQFRASRLVWGDIEYRFLVNRSSYLFAFGALGRYHRPKLLTEPNSSFKTTDSLYSTGFGISYKIRIGRLKFTYAISPDESIGNGKVHLGIKTRL